MPESLIFRNNLLFWSVLGVNIFSPVLQSIQLYMGNMYSFEHNGQGTPTPWFDEFYLVTKYTIGSEQLVSGIFVVVAVVLIRKFLKGSGMSGQVNYHKLGAQALLFLVYSISIVIFYYFIALQVLNDDNPDPAKTEKANR